jgi:NADH-quinone oxidoreductase subunit G
MTDVTIHIDGEAHRVPAGTNLLQALLAAGRPVPHACYHPSLSAPASCRLCLVAELGEEGESRLVTACDRSVADGQRLSLEGERIEAARRHLVDDLLLRHPADCAVCERTGECDLQELVAAHGGASTGPRLPVERSARVQLGPRLVLDRDRCTLCTRCVRFEAEVSGTHELALCGPAAEQHVAACGGGEVDHPLSGNHVELCPAGALTEPGERLRPKAWRMTGVSSTCPGCAAGCAVRVDVEGGRVQRLRSRGEARGAQDLWLCDHGRYGWQGDAERLREPTVDGEAVEWDMALAATAEGMERADHAAVLLGPYLTNEETFLLVDLAQRWEAQIYIWQATDESAARRFPGGFEIHAQRGPNVAGVAAVVQALGQDATDVAALAGGAGQHDAVYAVGGSLHGEEPELDLTSCGFVVTQEVVTRKRSPGGWTGASTVRLAAANPWTEKEGTWIDAAGRLQRVRAAVDPPGQCRSDFWIAAALWHGGPNRDTPEHAFARLAAHGAAPFHGTDYSQLDAQSAPAQGVAYGGGWSSLLQRRGLVPVEDHARRR